MSISEHHDYSNSFEDSQSSAFQTLTDDLKSHLYSSLRNKGIIDSLKSQIRQKLITELSNKRNIRHEQGSQNRDDIEEKKVIETASNSLVADHLKRNHFDYTLSVFVPETGLTGDKIFGPADLLQLLRINEETDFYKHLENLLKSSGKSFLWCFLQSLSNYCCKPSQDTNIQTEKSIPPISYSDRMSRIEVDFDNRQKQQDEQYRHKIDEKLNFYQKDLDDRYKQDLKSELERFKRNELEAIRKQERDKLRKEYESRRQEIENEYKEKLASLARREREGEEHIGRQREILERESYQSRQNFLQEVSSLRDRETQLRRDREQFEREIKVERDRLKIIEENLSKKEQALHEKQLSVDGHIQQEIQKMKLAEETKYMQRWKELELSEARAKEDAKMLDLEKESSRNLRDELLQKQRLYEEMEMADYPALKQENNMLKSELESLRSRFAEIQQNYNAECQKHQIAIHERSVALKDQADTVEENQQKGEEIKKLKEEIRALQRNLEEESIRGQKFTFRADEMQKQVDILNRESEELRQQLFQAEQVINKELYRRPLGYTPRTPRTNGPISDREPALTHSRYSLPHQQQTHLESSRSAVPQSPMITPRYFNSHGGQGGGQKSYENDRSLTPPGENSEIWDDVLYETKRRLRNLDQETEQVNDYYRNFQHRLADPQTHLSYFTPEISYMNMHQPHTNIPPPIMEARETRLPGNLQPREPKPRNKEKEKFTNKEEAATTKPLSNLQFQPRTDTMDSDSKKPSSQPQATAVTFDLHDNVPEISQEIHPPRFIYTDKSLELENEDNYYNQREPMTEMTEGATTSRDLGPTEKHLGPTEDGFVSHPETMVSMDDTWKSQIAPNVYSSEEQLNTEDEEDGVVVNLDDHWKQHEDNQTEGRKEESEEEPDSFSDRGAGPRHYHSESLKSEQKKEVEEDLNIDPELKKYMDIVKANKERERQQQLEKQERDALPNSLSNKEDIFEEDIEEDIKVDASEHSEEKSEGNSFW